MCSRKQPHLAGDNGLHEESEHGEHSQTAVLDLLDLRTHQATNTQPSRPTHRETHRAAFADPRRAAVSLILGDISLMHLESYKRPRVLHDPCWVPKQSSISMIPGAATSLVHLLAAPAELQKGNSEQGMRRRKDSGAP